MQSRLARYRNHQDAPTATLIGLAGGTGFVDAGGEGSAGLVGSVGGAGSAGLVGSVGGAGSAGSVGSTGLSAFLLLLFFLM